MVLTCFDTFWPKIRSLHFDNFVIFDCLFCPHGALAISGRQKPQCLSPPVWSFLEHRAKFLFNWWNSNPKTDRKVVYHYCISDFTFYHFLSLDFFTSFWSYHRIKSQGSDRCLMMFLFIWTGKYCRYPSRLWYPSICWWISKVFRPFPATIKSHHALRSNQEVKWRTVM